MTNIDELHPQVRIAEALESIAASLEKLANPLIVLDKDAKDKFYCCGPK